MPQDVNLSPLDLARRYLSEKRYERCIGALEQLLAGQPEHAEAWMLLAEACERIGDWNAALHALQQAAAYGGAAKSAEIAALIQAKQEVYRKVKTVVSEGGPVRTYIGEDDFVHLSKDGISLKYHIKQKDLHIENIFRTMKRIQVKVHERLACTPSEVAVEIYSSDDELRDETARQTGRELTSWVAGLYDGTIRVSSRNGDAPEPQQLYVLLSHEYVHLAVEAATGGRCPRWLDEGLALHFSQELTPEYAALLHKAAAGSATLPFDVLEKDFSLLREEDLMRLAYAQAASLTAYLVEYKGWPVIANMLSQLKNRPVQDVLMGLSLNYYLLEKQWLRWLNINHERHEIHEK